MRIPRHLCLVLGLLSLAVVTVSAEWSGDPYSNLPIADRTSEQVVPHVVSTSDGGCYVGWYDLSFGQYSICLQRLDANGYEQWPHNGILVSAHAQLSSVTDWGLTVDAQDNAVLVVSDARDGEDLDPHAYCIDPNGAFVWGADGVTLSSNADYEPAPVVTLAGDGDLVFAWGRYPDAGGSTIQMQRLSPAGVPRFPAGGIAVVSGGSEAPGFPRLAPAESGSVIMIWVRNTAYMGTKHLRAQKFSTAGAGVWPVVVNVYDAASVPNGYGPDIHPDGAGGALCMWHAAPGSIFNTYVQHLASSGTEVFPHNGITVSTNASRNHLDGALSFRPATGEFFVFWNERNAAQSQWGIYGQKFLSDGTRAWGAEGIAFVPVDNVNKHTQRSAPYADGAIAFFIMQEGGVDRVRGFRVDGAGNFVWPGSFVDLATYPSGKSRLPITQNAGGMVVLIWQDSRADFSDVYGQNIYPDGTLGVGGDAVAEREMGRHLVPNEPNPFAGTTRLALGAAARGVSVRVLDASGRRVRTLVADGVGTVLWDGTDDRGARLPGGVYFYGLAGPDRGNALRRAVLVR